MMLAGPTQDEDQRAEALAAKLGVHIDPSISIYMWSLSIIEALYEEIQTIKEPLR